MPARSSPVQQSRERLDLLAMWVQVPRREPDNSEISPIPDQSFFPEWGHRLLYAKAPLFATLVPC